MGSSTDVNVRRVSYNIVRAVLDKGKFLSDILGDTLSKHQSLDKKKRSYITYLTRGTIERLIELDAVISAYSSVRLNKLNRNIRNVLRLAVYELRYMDNVPALATCNEYVKLAGRVAAPALKAFVNGVLRSMVRDDFARVRLEAHEIYSLPKWMYDKLESEYGDVDRIATAFLSKRHITIRANLNKCSASRLEEILRSEGVSVEAIAQLDGAFEILSVDYIGGLKSFRDGLFYVQDVSSMMVGAKSDVGASDTVIDVCAAPGGKSLHIAQLMIEAYKRLPKGGTNTLGMVYAYDVSKNKVDIIRDNISRAGLNNIKADIRDATIYDESLAGKGDIVIADVPCSGIGVLAKKPDIKARLKESDIDELVKLQYNIIDNVKRYVKDQGKLIYSTCTISLDENSGNVHRFLDANSDFYLIEETQYMPDSSRDGFYIAIMGKRESHG